MDACVALVGVFLRPLVPGSYLFDAGFCLRITVRGLFWSDFWGDSVFSCFWFRSGYMVCQSTEAP